MYRDRSSLSHAIYYLLWPYVHIAIRLGMLVGEIIEYSVDYGRHREILIDLKDGVRAHDLRLWSC